jgi:hypothetical protein
MMTFERAWRAKPIILAAAVVVAPALMALDLSREIARLPKEKRPTAEQIRAAELEEEQQNKYLQLLRQRLEPQLKEWAQKGKPFLAHAIFPTDLPQASVPAFPGAEGAGRYAFGGRGGKVYVVRSLEDNGPDTFREACESAGPRTVVFNVAGIIHLKQPLHILAPYLTIAGQSAPGDGVCIAGCTTHVDTHDVVIRYMRFRRGTTNLFDRDDCLGGNPIGNVIVDHCSASWGLDENLSMYRHMYQPKEDESAQKLPTLNLTIQWCISSEALNTYDHAFGGTWGGCNTTFHHNLFACNTGRNPSIGMSYDFNFVNNVLFNWRHRTLDGGDQGSRVNCINNLYKPGPVTPDTPVRHRIGLPQGSTFKPDPTVRYGKWYVAGNVLEGDAGVTADNWAGGVQFNSHVAPDASKPRGVGTSPELLKQVRVAQSFPMSPLSTQSANEAYAAVLAAAGATLPRRDPVDERVIRQVWTGEVSYAPGKGIITDISQVGGYPDYQGWPESDLGQDGLPRWWKVKYALPLDDAGLGARDLQGDGYTVLEKYLDGLDPTKKLHWSDPSSNLNRLTIDKLRPPRL